MACYATWPWPNNIVPINSSLKCGEEWIHNHDEEDDYDDDFRGPITFHIQLPSQDSNNNNNQRRLKFSCRDKSSGVLLKSEPSVSKEDTFDGPCDPYFFEKGFYLEAKTGFQVWPGSRLMVEAFTCHNNDDGEGRSYNNYPSLVGGTTNVLEVGAGIGVVGSCLAAAGANVLITDLPVLVKHGIGPNLRRNARRAVADAAAAEEVVHGSQQCPEFLREASSLSLSDDDSVAFDAVRLGSGWANAAVLDWFKPVNEQLPASVTTAVDVIVACDCIFLRKLADPLLSTIATIFEHSKTRNPIFFFTFQRRNMLGLFIQLEELLGRIEERGWTVECVAWRNVEIEDDGCHENYLFRVTPAPASRSDSLLSIGRAEFIEEKKE